MKIGFLLFSLATAVNAQTSHFEIQRTYVGQGDHVISLPVLSSSLGQFTKRTSTLQVGGSLGSTLEFIYAGSALVDCASAFKAHGNLNAFVVGSQASVPSALIEFGPAYFLGAKWDFGCDGVGPTAQFINWSGSTTSVYVEEPPVAVPMSTPPFLANKTLRISGGIASNIEQSPCGSGIYRGSACSVGQAISVSATLTIDFDFIPPAGTPWHDVGGSSDGPLGTPIITAEGQFSSNEPFSFHFQNMQPSSTFFLVLGDTDANAAFSGGVFHPTTAFGPLLFPLMTNAEGEYQIGGTWPALPVGQTLLVQTWAPNPDAYPPYVGSSGWMAVAN